MSRLRINGTPISDPITIQRFQELVQEDRDIMDEAEISLDEILEAAYIIESITEDEFDYD